MFQVKTMTIKYRAIPLKRINRNAKYQFVSKVLCTKNGIPRSVHFIGNAKILRKLNFKSYLKFSVQIRAKR